MKTLTSGEITTLIWPFDSEDNLKADDLNTDFSIQYTNIFIVLSDTHKMFQLWLGTALTFETVVVQLVL